MSTKTFEPGMYRVHLASNTDSDWITFIAPLDEDGRLSLDKSDLCPRPYFFKATWNQDLFYGEVIRRAGEDGKIYLEWHSDDSDVTLTNLHACAMVLGAVVLIWETGDSASKSYPFTIRSIQKL